MSKKTTRFRGGLDLYQRKEPAFSREQRQLLSPKYVYLPMEEGTDPRLASAFLDKAEFEVLKEMDYPGVKHNTFGRFVLLESEEKIKEQMKLFQTEKPILMKEMEFDDLVLTAKRAFIIDEMDGVPLFRKLEAFKEDNIKVVIANAIDEEPYVSSSINTLLQKGDKVISALKIIGDVLKVKSTFALAYADIDDTKTSIPAEISSVLVRKVSGKYPMKGRAHSKILKYTDGQDYGLVGVQALLHLYRAVYFGKKQSTTIVTIAGDCINYACNVEVVIGTTIREALEFVGLGKDPARVIIRGSMAGVSVQSLDLPILHSEKALLAFEEDIKNEKLPCINCGSCASVCPSNLAPQFIYRYNKIEDKEAAKALQVEKCIECGCCSYVCPARLELAHVVKTLKNEKLQDKDAPKIEKKIEAKSSATKTEAKIQEVEVIEETILEEIAPSLPETLEVKETVIIEETKIVEEVLIEKEETKIALEAPVAEIVPDKKALREAAKQEKLRLREEKKEAKIRAKEEKLREKERIRLEAESKIAKEKAEKAQAHLMELTSQLSISDIEEALALKEKEEREKKGDAE